MPRSSWRPDPHEDPDRWRWYCRLCGGRGSQETEIDRDLEVMSHFDTCPYCKGQEIQEVAVARRLMHIWAYTLPPT